MKSKSSVMYFWKIAFVGITSIWCQCCSIDAHSTLTYDNLTGKTVNSSSNKIDNQKPSSDLSPKSSLDTSVSDETILRFFFTWTNGPKWRNKDKWLSPLATNNTLLFCEWHGITCTDESIVDDNGLPRVARIELSNNQLEGSVPLHLLLTQLTELKKLDLSGNSISFGNDDEQAKQLLGHEIDDRAAVSKLTYLDLSYTHASTDIGQFIFDLSEKKEGIHMPMMSNLYLGHAHITGTIPSTIFDNGWLNNLERLVLDGNDITGSIPASIGNLSFLRFLSMKENNLSGTLPDAISQLRKIRSIILGHNDLHGPLPNQWKLSIGDSILTFLEVLDLSHQAGLNAIGTGKEEKLGLIGELPSFAMSQRLKHLDLSYNSLSGSIPIDFLDNVDPNLFDYAYLQHNDLTGQIPSTSLKRLPYDSIYLEDNKITSISQDMCDASRGGAVATFGCEAILCKPGFYGPEIGRQEEQNSPCEKCETNLKYWGLTKCDLDESSDSDNVNAPNSPIGSPIDPVTFPPTVSTNSPTLGIGEKDILLSLYKNTGGSNWKKNNGWIDSELSDDDIMMTLESTYDPISESFCNWYGVTCGDKDKFGRETVVSLQLGANGLVGTPPDKIFFLENLQVLDLSKNSIVLNNFQAIKHAKNLKTLSLDECGIDNLKGLDHQNVVNTLEELHLEKNHLFGSTIPSEIYELKHLKEIYLDNNKFVGEISESIESLTHLTTFSASNNLLSGPLPSGIEALTDLSTLRLNKNRLTGQLTVLQNLTKLSIINLSNQRSLSSADYPGFSGPLPDFADFSMLRRLELKVNGLTGTISDTFLEGTVTESFEFVDLSQNFIGGKIPASFANKKNVYLKDNRITQIDSAVCKPLDGIDFGCDTILCSPGTYNPLGRRTSFDNVCLSCEISNGAKYYGSTTCSKSNDESPGNITENENNNDYVNNTDIMSNPDKPHTILPNPTSRSDVDILTVFYTTCGGRNWKYSTNWINQGQHVCTWYGITCNDKQEVIEIDLSANKVIGQLPHDIFHLKKLKKLVLKENPMTFDFHGLNNAKSLTKLDLSKTQINTLDGIKVATSLKEFHCSSNFLHGGFPDEILYLTNLESLQLDFNLFTGQLPTNLALLSNIGQLSLHNNNFDGHIPDVFSSMKNLHMILLQSNKLNGDIPSSLYSKDSLIFVDLSNQKTSDSDGLNGSLPPFKGSPLLKRLNLSGNSLKGPIPTTFLSGVKNEIFEFLDLSNNKLTGTVPSIMAQINFDKYDLSDNLISGINSQLCDPALGGPIKKYKCDAILCPPYTFNAKGRQESESSLCLPCASLPKDIFGSTKCITKPTENPTSYTPVILPFDTSEREILELFYSSCGGKGWSRQDNWLSSESVCNWFGVGCHPHVDTVETLTLSTNNIIGLIPNEVFELPNLKTLVLDSNKILFSFTGIENAKKLKSLDLTDTNLHSLENIENAKNLVELILGSNDIGGSFPQALFGLKMLEKLTLDYNKITGNLPPEINNLSNLQLLSLDSNQITGSIPKELGDLSNLSVLHLQHNSMTGSIPSEIENLLELTVIDLSFEKTEDRTGFIGELPSFKNHKGLKRLNLSHNSFNGTIPSDFLETVSDHNFESVDLKFNDLTGRVPKSLARLNEILLEENKISIVEDYCETKTKLSANEFDCDEFMCPPKTFSFTGKKDGLGNCKTCTAAVFYGTTKCKLETTSSEGDSVDSDSESSNIDIDGQYKPSLNILVDIDTKSERLILEKLYQTCGGYHWDVNDNWMSSQDRSFCEWIGIDCVDGLESVKSISLGANNLKGSPPKEIFLLPNLESLALYSNKLHGMDFSEIWKAKNLKELLLDATEIRSFDGISKAPKLKKLNLRFNNLRSEFPLELLQITSLTTLNLGHNGITGTLPTNIGSLTNLKTLLMTRNNIIGTLDGINFPSSLQNLDLSINIFSGSIPSTFLNAIPSSSILDIDLSDNLLTGVIPGELARFDKMNLNLMNNYISGFSDKSSLCSKTYWNNGDVGRYGCDGLICSSGSFSPIGRHSFAGECQECDTADFYGSSQCLPVNVIYKSPSSASFSKDKINILFFLTYLLGICGVLYITV